jgi:hypothetical protein
MPTRRSLTLLDKLEIIDNALLFGEPTAEQEARGQRLVSLANASPRMLDALRFALPYMEDLAASGDNEGERRAARLMRDAIIEAES